MIEVKNISKHFGGRTLFEDVSFIINDGEHVGVLGLNGSGKTTLFKILTGEESVDSGEIRVPQGYKIGYLNQFLSFKEETILKEACISIPKEEDFEEDKTYLAKAMLLGLGFQEEQFNISPLLLSGGYQVRLQLAKLLLTSPDLLLLDEPSNYLDIVSIRWLIRFFKSWKKEILLISHDRDFVNSIVSSIIGIHRTKILKVAGKIQDYERVIFEKEDLYEKTRLNQEAKVAHMEEFVRRFKAKATKAKAAQSRIKMIEKIERLDELQEIKSLEFKFSEEPLQSKTAITIKDISFGYEKDCKLIKDLSLIIGSKDRVGIIGKNGKGKTTLLKLIAGELTLDTGEIVLTPKAKLGYFGQTNIERLNPNLTIEEEILSASPESSRTRVRNICGTMMFSGDDATKKISVLSGGEKSRVLLGKLLTTPNNILLLDEPTNHLDMQSTDSLIEASKNFNGAVIIVTHSEAILRDLVTKLIVFDGGKSFLFDGTYDEFLDKIGWEEEINLEKEDNENPAKNSKKEARKERALKLQQETKILGPIKNKIKKIEDDITKKEEILKPLEEKLLALYAGEYSDDVKNTEKDIAYLKMQIDELFLKLEEEEEKLKEAKKNM